MMSLMLIFVVLIIQQGSGAESDNTTDYVYTGNAAGLNVSALPDLKAAVIKLGAIDFNVQKCQQKYPKLLDQCGQIGIQTGSFVDDIESKCKSMKPFVHCIEEKIVAVCPAFKRMFSSFGLDWETIKRAMLVSCEPDNLKVIIKVRPCIKSTYAEFFKCGEQLVNASVALFPGGKPSDLLGFTDEEKKKFAAYQTQVRDLTEEWIENIRDPAKSKEIQAHIDEARIQLTSIRRSPSVQKLACPIQDTYGVCSVDVAKTCSKDAARVVKDMLYVFIPTKCPGGAKTSHTSSYTTDEASGSTKLASYIALMIFGILVTLKY